MEKKTQQTTKIILIVVGLIILALGAYYQSWLGLLGILPLAGAFVGRPASGKAGAEKKEEAPTEAPKAPEVPEVKTEEPKEEAPEEELIKEGAMEMPEEEKEEEEKKEE